MEGGNKEAVGAEAPLRREVDSLDDFEHLGHDSSPLKEFGGSSAGDLLLAGLNPASATRDVINTGGVGGAAVPAAATGKLPDDDLSSFDPLVSASTQHQKPPSAPGLETAVAAPEPAAKMDSNLLEMGDAFPDRKEADAKLDKFLQEMTSFAPPKAHTEIPEIPKEQKDLKDPFHASKIFMDMERTGEPILAPPKKPSPSAPEHHVEQLERYSDSDPDDDFKPSKYQDFPKQAELPESFGSTDNFKGTGDTFKDFREPEPEPPKKDHPSALPPKSAEPPRQKTPEPELPKPKTPEPPKQKTPEPEPPAKQKTPEPKPPVKVAPPPEPSAPPKAPVTVKAPEAAAAPVCKKPEAPVSEAQTTKKATVIDAEAIFCRMGLDTLQVIKAEGSNWLEQACTEISLVYEEEECVPKQPNQTYAEKIQWSEEESVYLFERFEEYIQAIGPAKRFRSKRKMWDQIADDLEKVFDGKKTSIQCENRYKTVMRRKSANPVDSADDVVDKKEAPTVATATNWSKLDHAPSVPTYEMKKQKLIETETSGGCANCGMTAKEKDQKEYDSLRKTLWKIHTVKEEGRERRHREKMKLFKKIFEKIS